MTSNHIDANLKVTSAGIQVSEGLSSLIISSPPNYPSGRIAAGQTLSPAPEARLVDLNLKPLGQVLCSGERESERERERARARASERARERERKKEKRMPVFDAC